MRLYKLVRHEDVSGFSGTGHVAEIVQFSDGRCVMRWVAKDPDGNPLPSSIVLYDSLEDIRKIHGHNGASEVVVVTRS